MKGKQKILVAGGTGFLGRRIVKILEKKGMPHIVASKSLGTDFRDFKQTLNFFNIHKPTIVIHAAAFIGGIKFGLEHEGEIYFNNIIMSTNLIEAARISKVEKFISPIANCAYPGTKIKILKESEFWDGPLHESVLTYGLVRKAQWAQTWAYHNQYKMNFVNLILPNMYGPGDYFDPMRSHALGALLHKFIKAKKENYPEVVVLGSGKPVREWLYVDDGALALVRAININASIEPINIGIGKGISIRKLAYTIKRIVGYEGEIVFDKSKPDGAPYKVMDITKGRKIFKWQATTDIEKGIKKTYEWYKKYYPQNV